MSITFSQQIDKLLLVLILNPQLKWFFYPLITTYYLKFIIKMLWKYYEYNISLQRNIRGKCKTGLMNTSNLLNVHVRSLQKKHICMSVTESSVWMF